MKMRVEELAARAEVSVDTIRFYQKQGLLPAPEREGRVAWYSELHNERLERIRDLQGKGLTLAIIRRLVSGHADTLLEPLAEAVVREADDRAEEFLTLDELSARSAVPRPLLEAVVRDGLLVPRIHDGEPRFTPADVSAVAAGLKLVEAGFPLSDFLALARRHHAAIRQLANEAVELFDLHVRSPLRASGLPVEEAAERLVEVFRGVLPAVTEVVSHHFRRVLLQVAQEHIEAVGEPEEIAAARVEAQRRLEVVWPS